ncbi:hypothetical protein D3C80_1196080 [compost metagenome]
MPFKRAMGSTHVNLWKSQQQSGVPSFFENQGKHVSNGVITRPGMKDADMLPPLDLTQNR